METGSVANNKKRGGKATLAGCHQVQDQHQELVGYRAQHLFYVASTEKPR
jgi:hypothetical protein